MYRNEVVVDIRNNVFNGFSGVYGAFIGESPLDFSIFMNDGPARPSIKDASVYMCVWVSLREILSLCRFLNKIEHVNFLGRVC